MTIGMCNSYRFLIKLGKLLFILWTAKEPVLLSQLCFLQYFYNLPNVAL